MRITVAEWETAPPFSILEGEQYGNVKISLSSLWR